MNTSRALVSKFENGVVSSEITSFVLPDLATGEVLIKSEYSSLNYKDALGVSGKGRIFKKFPIIAGIDVAGTIAQSRSEKFKEGDHVLVTGRGLGEDHDGGYSEFVIEHEKNVVLRDAKLSARNAMIWGTAGFTAALCAERMILNSQIPEMGPILVTGATGGVGQFAIHIFNTLGFEVHALTSKREMQSRLLSMGAKKVLFPSQIDLGSRPLETVRFGGAVDNIGGNTLSKILSHIELWGNVACVGLADNPSLNTTVMPFILRGVSLLGISSNNTPYNLRKKIWQRLSHEFLPESMENFVSQTIGLEQIPETASKMIDRQTYGRLLVDVRASQHR